jgi:hypothetical protein
LKIPSPIGTPTGDEIRTAIQADTRTLFMNINGYRGKTRLEKTMRHAVSLLEKYAEAKELRETIVE